MVGGEGGRGGGGWRVKSYAGKIKEKREETGARGSLAFSPRSRTLYFSSSNFRPRPTILTHGTG